MNKTPQQSPAIVVIGATGSIGATLSRRLVAQGNRIVIAGRNQRALEVLAMELDSPFFMIDVEKPETISESLQFGNDMLNPIHGVVNCIGTALLKPAHQTTLDEWKEIIDVNLTSAFLTIHSSAKLMRKTGGSIVLISSAAARIGLPNHEAIAAAKAGIIGLTLSAAATYANRNIRINAVAPGLVKSQMTRKLWETDASAATSMAMHPLSRLGEPSDVASAIEWLLNPENSWITGQILGVDGGLGTLVPRIKTLL